MAATYGQRAVSCACARSSICKYCLCAATSVQESRRSFIGTQIASPQTSTSATKHVRSLSLVSFAA
eukprot:1441981-Amphidinium_carterae.1